MGKINSKYRVCVVIIFVCICFLFFVIYKLNNIDSKFEEKQWAYYNYGQSINDNIGIRGVDVNIENVWDYTKGDGNIIALVDTGVEIRSENKEHFVTHRGSNNSCDVDNVSNNYYGWDFYNNDPTIYDDYLYDYHGTYIFNIICNIAPEVKILPCKFLEGTVGDAKDAISALEYAISSGASIINCSWSFEKEDKYLYELMKKNKDVIFICAAGNNRINLDKEKIYPASYDLDNVISVAAINNRGELYKNSGYGNVVTIGAPGEDIWVDLPEKDMAFVSGTSAATAFVSGTVALMKTVNPKISAKGVKEILVSTAKKNKSLKNACMAGGYLDIFAAVNACKVRG